MVDTYDPLFPLALASEDLLARHEKKISIERLKARILRGDLVATEEFLDGTRKTITNAAQIPNLDPLHPKIGILESELERFAATLKTRKRPTVDPKILLSLYKALLVLAVEVYKYDPTKARNQAAEDISRKAYLLSKKTQCDLKIDPGTVNDRLREAVEALQYLPPKK